MKVLWFEVTTPQRYKSSGQVLGGWQDSLERIVQCCSDIDLIVAFESSKEGEEIKIVDGITYVPIHVDYSTIDRIRNKWNFEVYARKVELAARALVEKVKPDLIHVFGTEWPFGRVAKYVKCPVVIHIMGAMIPYVNALCPPNFKYDDVIASIPFWNVKNRLGYRCAKQRLHSWSDSERVVWSAVENYMGRTEWDRSVSGLLHPGRKYFHVDEAMRPVFLDCTRHWTGPADKKVRLFSTGCSSFWKGPDLLLQTAKILTDRGLDFDWFVAGRMDPQIKKCVEKHFGTSFIDNHVHFLGFVSPDRLMKELCESTMYVHTAYIDNSPNSICEAQCLGVPVVSTNVGGVSSLVHHQEDGVLVPANDPWQMAQTIVDLADDCGRMERYSEKSMVIARERHSDEHIKAQLLDCYRSLL